MERVLNASGDRRRRKDDVKKMVEQNEQTLRERAAQDIMSVICGKPEQPDAAERPAEAGSRDKRSGRRAALRAYNMAINALSVMGGVTSDNAELCKQVLELECALRATRSVEFEALVDWAAIAKE